MTSLLAGLKFVSKDKKKRKEVGGDAEGGSQAPATAYAPPAKSQRMDWMSERINLLGRRKDAEPEDPEVIVRRDAEEEKKRKIQEEIDAGIRDQTGLLIGLNFMNKKPDNAGGSADFTVGDDGATWRARALKRAKEEAQRTGRPLEEIVRERWGSLEELTKGLDTRRGGGGRRHGGGDRGRDTGGERRGWKRTEYKPSSPDERRKRDDDSWRTLLDGGSGTKRAGLSLGREQSDKAIIGRFSSKLSEALGRLDPKELGGDEDGGSGKRGDRSNGRERRRERSWSRDRGRGRDRERESERKRRSRSRSGEQGRELGGGRREEEEEGRRRGDDRRDTRDSRKEDTPTERGRELGRGRREEEEEEDRRRGDDRREPSESRKEVLPRVTEEEESKVDVVMEQEPAQPVTESVTAPQVDMGADDGEPMVLDGAEDEERVIRERQKRRKALLADFVNRPRPPPPESSSMPLPPREPFTSTPASTVAAAAATATTAVALPDPNKLAAQALKAKLKGDMATHGRLMKEAEDARKAQQAAKEEQVKREDEAAAVRIVHAMDRHGRPIQVGAKEADMRREDLKRGARKGKLKSNETYTQDTDLQELVRRERMGGDDMDREFVRNMMRLGSRFKGTEMGGGDGAGIDEEDFIDTKMFEKAEDRMTEKKRQDRQKQAAVREHGKWEDATKRCALCMESESFKKHLMIALGEHTYLVYRTGQFGLVPEHTAIVPVKHAEAGTQCDEEVWVEMSKFKASLRKLFASKGQSVIFLETAMTTGSRKRHATIEAVPVPREAGLDAPLYFKQGLLEADEQWSQHKKLIDTKGRNIRSVVPKNFPYFHVEWAPDGGYAHVVEDKDKFPADFGMAVVAGMLGIDPPRFDRKGQQRRDDHRDLQAVKDFLRTFQPFDWTVELEGGEYMG